MKTQSRIAEIPVFVAEFDREELPVDGLDRIVEYFIAEIERHPFARFIGQFDHFSHTRDLPEGEIAEGILDARNVVFCFGMAIPDAESIAFRPRSIGITERTDGYVVTFLEAPMPLVNSAMEAWTEALLELGQQHPET